MAIAPAAAPSGVDEAAVALPAQFVNHVHITMYSGGLVRLSFAEAPTPDAPLYRMSMIMTQQDARTIFQGILNGLSGVPAPSPGPFRN